MQLWIEVAVRARARGLLVLLCAGALLGQLSCLKSDDLTSIRPGTVFVDARDTLFTPESVTVAVGVPVRWTNEGAIQHSVVSDSALWQSGLLLRNWWFEVTFDSAGTYSYHCSEHPALMSGVVVVQ